jgi:lipid-binding SYLF domain-containing protein
VFSFVSAHCPQIATLVPRCGLCVIIAALAYPFGRARKGMNMNSLCRNILRSTAIAALALGIQAKSIIIAFMTQDALDKFRNSDGWKVGIDGSVALIDVGAGKTIDSSNIKDPVVGFIFGSKGLMYNLTLEGSKITKLDKS